MTRTYLAEADARALDTLSASEREALARAALANTGAYINPFELPFPERAGGADPKGDDLK